MRSGAAVRSISPRSLFSSVFLAVVVVSSTLAACASQSLDGGSRHGFFVRSALAPPVHPTDGGGCRYTADPNAAALFEGRSDLGISDSYDLTLLAQDTETTASTSITSAHVVLRTPSQEMIREFEAVTNGFIGPGAVGIASVTVIDAPSRDLLLETLPNRVVSRTVVADVTLRGRDAAGGPEVSTPIFSFAIKVCNGCLVDFSTGNDPTAPKQPNCLRPADPIAPRPCATGQDEAVSCQLCVSTRPACDPLALAP